MPSTESSRSGPIPEDAAFVRQLVTRIPALLPLWDKHLADEFGEVLPYVFLADVARWAESHAGAQEDAVRALVSGLNDGLDRGQGDVPNLILAGFVEAVPAGGDLARFLDGSLGAWLDYDLGLTGPPPPPSPHD